MTQAKHLTPVAAQETRHQRGAAPFYHPQWVSSAPGPSNPRRNSVPRCTWWGFCLSFREFIIDAQVGLKRGKSCVANTGHCQITVLWQSYTERCQSAGGVGHKSPRVSQLAGSFSGEGWPRVKASHNPGPVGKVPISGYRCELFSLLPTYS